MSQDSDTLPIPKSQQEATFQNTDTLIHPKSGSEADLIHQQSSNTSYPQPEADTLIPPMPNFPDHVSDTHAHLPPESGMDTSFLVDRTEPLSTLVFPVRILILQMFPRIHHPSITLNPCSQQILSRLHLRYCQAKPFHWANTLMRHLHPNVYQRPHPMMLPYQAESLELSWMPQIQPHPFQSQRMPM